LIDHDEIPGPLSALDEQCEDKTHPPLHRYYRLIGSFHK